MFPILLKNDILPNNTLAKSPKI